MSKFEYPKLSIQEIISILAESQIAAVSDKDIKHPTADFICDLYTRLLGYLDLLHEEDYTQIDFDVLEQFENPDNHSGSIPIMTLFTRVKDVITSIRCPMKFTFKDLIKPDGARSEYFISAILNYCLHKDTKMELLQPVVEDLNDLDSQRQEWDDKTAKLNAALAEYNEARERELPLVQEIEAQVKELRQTIQDLNKHQMSQRTTIKKLEKKIEEQVKQTSQTKFDLQQSAQLNADLHSKIVQSPDKLQRTLDEKKLAREEAKNAERSAMQSFHNKNEMVDVYTEALEKMTEHFAQMQALSEQMNSAKSIERDYNALKVKYNEDVVLDKSLEAKEVDRRSKVEKLDELRKQLEREKSLKFEESAKEMDKVKLDLESRRRDLEARQREVEAVLAKVNANNSETMSRKEAGAAKVQELEYKAEEVVMQFQQYIKPLTRCMAEAGFEAEVA